MSSVTLAAKVGLGARIWMLAADVRRRMKRTALPELVASLGSTDVRTSPVPPRALGAAVHRALAPAKPTCLVQSLVLYRLLREQGTDADLVIGLPDGALGTDAHSWIEVDGTDVGPPPGRLGHVEMARYR